MASIEVKEIDITNKKMMKQFKSMGKKKFFGKMPFNM